ncbi:type II secretion system protein M [Marinicauda sp. Alg238-R41]|uniref:type II secretion system protein M n=1 Tax=Marinicauda sp. Alg238-R41 TaxID=2993447 RepID=UPI0022E2520B|nr:type II secretion system protein M [Marinicauda sp. Alg238-R41]
MKMDMPITFVRGLWARQTPREQVLLAVCAGLMLAALVWFALVSPALSYRNAMRAGFEAQVEDHMAVIAGIERYRGLQTASATQQGQDQPLRTLVANRAREAGITITRVQPLENGQLSVWAEQAPEAQLMALLVALADRDNVHASRVSLDREASGLVRAQLVLGRGGA